jgi:hypothetical protein
MRRRALKERRKKKEGVGRVFEKILRKEGAKKK